MTDIRVIAIAGLADIPSLDKPSIQDSDDTWYQYYQMVFAYNKWKELQIHTSTLEAIRVEVVLANEP